MILLALLIVLTLICCGSTSLWCRRQYQISMLHRHMSREQATPMASCCANQPRISEDRSQSDNNRSQSYINESNELNYSKLVKKKKKKKG